MEVIGLQDTSPASIVLQYIRRHGQATIKDLERVLEVSTTAVREHLAHLQSYGLLATSTLRYGPGRPRLVYTLTDKAQRLFPKNYDLLIHLLLQELSSEGGMERVEQLLERVSSRLANEYAERISATEREERLKELRVSLESQGIPSEVQPSGDGITIFSCPYFDVAQEHAEVCTMDRQMLERVLGEKMIQAHSIREGHHHCRFNVHDKEQENP